MRDETEAQSLISQRSEESEAILSPVPSQLKRLAEDIRRHLLQPSLPAPISRTLPFPDETRAYVGKIGQCYVMMSLPEETVDVTQKEDVFMGVPQGEYYIAVELKRGETILIDEETYPTQDLPRGKERLFDLQGDDDGSFNENGQRIASITIINWHVTAANGGNPYVRFSGTLRFKIDGDIRGIFMGSQQLEGMSEPMEVNLFPSQVDFGTINPVSPINTNLPNPSL